MSWAALFERAAAYGVDEAAVRQALAERRAGPADAAGDGDDGDGPAAEKDEDSPGADRS